ncbi:MAG: hypothetical protein KGJ14_09610, partial [Nitrospirota bacterium]|nr:hypothetical protein [Nitrospirota bacterium]
IVDPLPPSDLVVTNVVAPTQVIDGSTFDITYTVTNLGAGPTDVDGWTDSVWLARDAKRPDSHKGDVAISNSLARSGLLEVGQSYTRTLTYTAPLHSSGRFFITPWADSYGVVTEDAFSNVVNPDDPNEIDNNNYKARIITIISRPPPDLVMESVTADPTAVAGGSVTVGWTVSNQGADATQETSWADRVILSDQATLHAPGAKEWVLGDIQHNGALGVGESYRQQRTFSLGPSVTGRYVFVETAGGVWEGPFTTNNVGSASANTTAAPADLRVASVTASPSNFSGEKTTVQWTVENVGAPVWGGTRYWTDNVFLSPYPTFDLNSATKVAKVTHSQTTPLGTGDSYQASAEIALPPGIDGTYYVHVVTDGFPSDSAPGGPQAELDFGGTNDGAVTYYGSTVYEARNDANNIGTGSVPVTYREADLAISNLVVPTSAGSGDTVSISWTVTNIGTRETRNGSWSDQLYLSSDPSLSSNDSFLVEAVRVGKLAPGVSYTRTMSVRLPDGISGDFYLLARADSLSSGPSGQVQEFRGEGNNMAQAPLHIDPAN